MPIKGTLLADFTSFYDAVNKAEVELKQFASGAGQVEKSLARMVDTFSGRKLIQDATLMAQAVEDIGGVAKLTEKELARVSATAAEATAKLRAMGQTVPPQLQRLATAARAIPTTLTTVATRTATATTALGNFQAGLQQTDKVLAALGVHMGPQIQAIGELGNVAGKTAASLGTIGTAGAVLGAGLAGWQIGRMIAEFFDLDRAIGNATAKLLGFGDVAAQTALATADVLEKARRIPGGQNITNIVQAQQLITDYQKRFAESLNTSTNRVMTWSVALDQVRRAGQLEALTRDLASQNSTLEELSAQYGISVRALEYYQRQLRATAADEKDVAAARRKAEEELRRQIAAIEAFQYAVRAASYEVRKLATMPLSLALPTLPSSQAISQELRAWGADIDLTQAIPPDIENQMVSAGREVGQEVGQSYVDGVAEVMSFGFTQHLGEMIVGLQSFKQGWEAIWRDIRQVFANILADMLNTFVEKFLKQMLAELAATKLGTKLASVFGGAAVSGATAAAAGTAAGTTVIAGTGIPVVAGAGAAGTGLGAGAGAGAGAGSSAALLAFLTNPITIAAVAAAVVGLGIWKKGWFRGGEEALKVNPSRDAFFQQFQQQYGGSQFESLQRAFSAKGISGDIAQELIRALYAADTVKEFNEATRRMTDVLSGRTLTRDAQWHITVQPQPLLIDGREVARTVGPAMVNVILRENPDGSRTALRRGLAMPAGQVA